MTTRKRLDAELVRRGFAESADEAGQLIEARRVVVAGTFATNAARMTLAADSLHVEAPPARYVGRGGFKLEAALQKFQIDPTGRTAIDIGASTGGFTDCLLQHGATSVTALDVGRAQLHERLRSDPRVKNLEKTDIRSVSKATFNASCFGLATVDLSFVSLTAVTADVVALLCDGADLILLIKPQFEATHEEATRGAGVISDPAIWRRSLEKVVSAMFDCGAATIGIMASPIRGAEGNVEFLAWLQVTSHNGGARPNFDALIDRVIGDVD